MLNCESNLAETTTAVEFTAVVPVVVKSVLNSDEVVRSRRDEVCIIGREDVDASRGDGIVRR